MAFFSFLLEWTTCFCFLVFLRFQGGKCETKSEFPNFPNFFPFRDGVFYLIRAVQNRTELITLQVFVLSSVCWKFIYFQVLLSMHHFVLQYYLYSLPVLFKSDNTEYKTYTIVPLMHIVDLLQVSKGSSKKLILKRPEAKDCSKQVTLWPREVSMVESRKPLA